MSELPKGWESCLLDEINHPERPICYGILMPGPDLPEGVPYVKVRNIRADKVLVDEVHRTSVEIESKFARSRLRTGDVLVSIRGTYGRTAAVPAELDGGNITQDTARVAPVGVDVAYVRLFMQSPAAQNYFKAVARGVAVKGVNIGDLRKLPVPVAPVTEQERIVGAIEEAFSKLDAGEAGLRTARQLLKRMRDSVLAAAVSGRLVPQDPTDTPASTLLADLGVEPIDRGGGASLPSGWAWATVESIAAAQRNALAIGPFGSNLKVSDYAPEGVPLVFVRNIRQRDFQTDLKFVCHEKAEELASHAVSKGDVLVTKMGDPPGDTAVYSENVPAIITADCIKVACGPSVLPEFLSSAIASGETRRLLLDATRGVAQKKVSLGRFRSLPVPIPPIDEQRRIVTEIERQFSFIEACERSIDEGITRSAALRRSILKSAFEGSLVPQDLSDEPAAILLERIRAERVQRDAVGNPKRRRQGTVKAI